MSAPVAPVSLKDKVKETPEQKAARKAAQAAMTPEQRAAFVLEKEKLKAKEAEEKAKLQAAKTLHDQDVAAVTAAQQLQHQLSSMITSKTSQLNGITSELEGMKQSIHLCLNSANDFQAKLNEQLKGYIQTLKKYQALRAVEEAAEAHVKLAHDALSLIQARSAKLEADEKKAEAAADVAVKKLLPTVPAHAPQQISKAFPSK